MQTSNLAFATALALVSCTSLLAQDQPWLPRREVASVSTPVPPATSWFPHRTHSGWPLIGVTDSRRFVVLASHSEEEKHETTPFALSSLLEQLGTTGDNGGDESRILGPTVNLATPTQFGEPVEELPANTTNNRDGLYSADAMIAPLGSARELFRGLEAPSDLSQKSRDLISDSADLLRQAVMIEKGVRQNSDSLEWPPVEYTWISPVFAHNPLYFEQPNLERYGQCRHGIWQPAISTAHFFGSILLVPYKTLTHHPREKFYTLGNGRPGNCVAVQCRTFLGQSTPGEFCLYYKENSGYR